MTPATETAAELTPRQIFESIPEAYNTWDAAFPEAMAKAQQYLDALEAERVARDDAYPFIADQAERVAA